jgi:type I restriction enzyme, S subunit
MAGEWRTVRLEEIASTDRKGFAMGPFGSNIKSENYKATGIPVLRGVNLGESGFLSNDLVYLSEEKAEELKNSQAFPGDLVFVAQGTVGKVGLVPNQRQFQKTVLSQNLMKFSCDRVKADPRFFYYFFVSSEGQHTIMSRVNPTGVPCISRPLSSLKDFVVPFPPLAAQRAIASVLARSTIRLS